MKEEKNKVSSTSYGRHFSAGWSGAGIRMWREEKQRTTRKKTDQ